MGEGKNDCIQTDPPLLRSNKYNSTESQFFEGKLSGRTRLSLTLISSMIKCRHLKKQILSINCIRPPNPHIHRWNNRLVIARYRCGCFNEKGGYICVAEATVCMKPKNTVFNWIDHSQTIDIYRLIFT